MLPVEDTKLPVENIVFIKEAQWGGKNDGKGWGMETWMFVGRSNRFQALDPLPKSNLSRLKVLQDVSCRNIELPLEGTKNHLSLFWVILLTWNILATTCNYSMQIRLFFFYFSPFFFEKQLVHLMEVFTLIACPRRLQGRFSPRDLIPFLSFFPTHWPPHGSFQSMSQSKPPLRRFSP